MIGKENILWKIGCELLWMVKLRAKIKTLSCYLKESVRLLGIREVVALKSQTRRSRVGEQKWVFNIVTVGNRFSLGKRYTGLFS